LGEDIEADLDPKILDKATFTTSKRCFDIATDDKKEYEEWGKEHERTIFTDREHVPSTPLIDSTHKFQSVAGCALSWNLSSDGTASHKLAVAAMLCASCVSEKDRRLRVST
jgi:hypothetical protein